MSPPAPAGKFSAAAPGTALEGLGKNKSAFQVEASLAAKV
jgi:hypothetical protein